MIIIEKNIIIISLIALAFLPLFAAAHTSGSALNPPEIAKRSPLQLQLGRDINYAARARCVKWKTRCIKRKFCQLYYKHPCYVCRKYKGYSEYKYRRTCDYNTMQRNRMRGYWCYRFNKGSRGRCKYIYKKFCKNYCVKAVYQ